MNKSDKAAAIVGVFLVMIGVATCITLCSRHVQHAKGGLLLMGYSNGTDAYNGSCRNKPSLIECMNCCQTLTAGMDPVEKGICIDLCLDQWEKGGDSIEDVVLDLTEVASTGQETDRISITSARGLLVTMQYSARPRVSRMAAGVCRQLNISEAASL